MVYPGKIQVKAQILDCKEANVLCNALCGNHVPDHLAFQEINKDDAMDATMLVAQKNGMYKNVEMCQDCLRKTQKIEEFCLRKLFNSDFFWS